MSDDSEQQGTATTQDDFTPYNPPATSASSAKASQEEDFTPYTPPQQKPFYDQTGQLHTAQQNKSDEQVYQEAMADQAKRAANPPASAQMTDQQRADFNQRKLQEALASPTGPVGPTGQPIYTPERWAKARAAVAAYPKDTQEETYYDPATGMPTGTSVSHPVEDRAKVLNALPLDTANKVLVQPRQAIVKSAQDTAKEAFGNIAVGAGDASGPGAAYRAAAGYKPATPKDLPPIVHAATNVAGETVGAMADPAMLPFMASGPAGAAMRKAAGGFFATQMGKGAVEQAGEFGRLMDRPTYDREDVLRISADRGMSEDDAEQALQSQGFVPQEAKYEAGANAIIQTLMAAVGGTHLADVQGGKVNVRGLDNAYGVSAFGGKIKGVVGSTPEKFGAGVQVGDRTFATTIPRNGGGPKPGPGVEIQPPQPVLSEGEQAMVRLSRTNGDMPPAPKPPAPPKPPPISLDPDRIAAIGQQLSGLSPQDREGVLIQLHSKLAQALIRQGKFTGPDGKLEIIKSVDDAGRVAQKIINDSVAAHDQRTAAQQQPANTQTATAVQAPPQRTIQHPALHPENVAKLTQQIASMTNGQRPQAILDAHANLVKAMTEANGRFVGPDGLMHVVKPEQYDDRATQFINDAIANHDKATAEQQKTAEKEAAKQKVAPAATAIQGVLQRSAERGSKPSSSQTQKIEKSEAIKSLPPDESNTEAAREAVRKVSSGEELTPEEEALGNRIAARQRTVQKLSPQDAAKLNEQDYKHWTFARAGNIISNPQTLVELSHASLLRGADPTQVVKYALVHANFLEEDPAVIIKRGTRDTIEEARQLAHDNREHNEQMRAAIASIEKIASGVRPTAPVSGKVPSDTSMTTDTPAVQATIQQIPEGQHPAVESKKESPQESAAIAQPPAPVQPQEAAKIGKEDRESGRTILQPSHDVIQNERLAGEAAPELMAKLGQVVASVPGTTFDRLRPQKELERVDQKIEGDGKPPETVPDYLAAQVAIDSPAAKDAFVEELKNHFDVVKVEDHFLEGKKELANYPSVNVQVRMGNQLTAEIQGVPREVQERSNESHGFYTAGREAELRGDQAERDKQYEQAAKIHDEQMAKFRERNGIAAQEEKPMALQDFIAKTKGSTAKLKERIEANRHSVVAVKEGKSPSTPSVEDMVKDAGGEYKGRELGMVWFNDPQTNGTMAIKEDGISVEKIKANIEKSRAAFKMAEEMMKGAEPEKSEEQPKTEHKDLVAIHEGTAPATERRQPENAAKRKSIDEMTEKEAKEELAKLREESAKQKEESAKQKEASYISDTTGLRNKKYFQDHQAELMAKYPRFGFGDLDDFKRFNDHFGAEKIVDNVVLRPTGHIFREAVKDEGDSVLIIHRSGDEFFILGKDDAVINRVAERVDKLFSETIFEYTTSDGKVITKKGTGLTHGIGDNEESARKSEKANKIRRRELGLRSGDRDIVAGPGTEGQQTAVGNDTGRHAVHGGRNGDTTQERTRESIQQDIDRFTKDKNQARSQAEWQKAFDSLSAAQKELAEYKEPAAAVEEKATSKASTQPEGTKPATERIVDVLTKHAQPYTDNNGKLRPNYLTMSARKLREQFPDIPKKEFDDHVAQLQKGGKIFLHEHGHEGTLSPEEKAQLIHVHYPNAREGDRDKYYVGIALREQKEPEAPKLETPKQKQEPAKEQAPAPKTAESNPFPNGLKPGEPIHVLETKRNGVVSGTYPSNPRSVRVNFGTEKKPEMQVLPASKLGHGKAEIEQAPIETKPAQEAQKEEKAIAQFDKAIAHTGAEVKTGAPSPEFSAKIKRAITLVPSNVGELEKQFKGAAYQREYFTSALEKAKDAWERHKSAAPKVEFSQPRTELGKKIVVARLVDGSGFLTIKEGQHNTWTVEFSGTFKSRDGKSDIHITQVVDRDLSSTSAKDVAEDRLRSGRPYNPDEPFTGLDNREAKVKVPKLDTSRPRGFYSDQLYIKVPGDGHFLINNKPSAIARAIKGAEEGFAPVKHAREKTGMRIPKSPEQFDNAKYIVQLEKEIADLQDQSAKEKMAMLRGESNPAYVGHIEDQLKAAKENLEEARQRGATFNEGMSEEDIANWAKAYGMSIEEYREYATEKAAQLAEIEKQYGFKAPLKTGVPTRASGSEKIEPKQVNGKEETPVVAAKLLAAINRIAQSPGTSVTFYRLRKLPEFVGTSKTAFDRAAILLQQQRKAIMLFHDHAQNLPKDQQDEFVRDENGRYYVSITTFDKRGEFHESPRGWESPGSDLSGLTDSELRRSYEQAKKEFGERDERINPYETEIGRRLAEPSSSYLKLTHVAAKYVPPQGMRPPTVHISIGARDMIADAIGGHHGFMGVNTDKDFAIDLVDRLEKTGGANQIVDPLKKAIADAGKSGINLVVKNAPKEVEQEELFHSLQRILGEGSTRIHLNEAAVKRLLAHPAAKELAWALSSAYDDMPPAVKVLEIAAKIAAGDTMMNISSAKVSDWFASYLEELEKQHGTDKLESIFNESFDRAKGLYEQYREGRRNTRTAGAVQPGQREGEARLQPPPSGVQEGGNGTRKAIDGKTGNRGDEGRANKGPAERSGADARRNDETANAGTAGRPAEDIQREIDGLIKELDDPRLPVDEYRVKSNAIDSLRYELKNLGRVRNRQTLRSYVQTINNVSTSGEVRRFDDGVRRSSTQAQKDLYDDFLEDYKKDPAFKVLFDASRGFVNDNMGITEVSRDIIGVPRLHIAQDAASIDNAPIIDGLDGSKVITWTEAVEERNLPLSRLRPFSEVLLDAINSSDAMDKPLYRGMNFTGIGLNAYKGTGEQITGAKPGDAFKLPLSSFSLDEKVAKRFASEMVPPPAGLGGKYTEDYSKGVILKVEGPTKTFAINLFSGWPEAELITQGIFRIKSNAIVNGIRTIALSQEATYDSTGREIPLTVTDAAFSLPHGKSFTEAGDRKDAERDKIAARKSEAGFAVPAAINPVGLVADAARAATHAVRNILETDKNRIARVFEDQLFTAARQGDADVLEIIKAFKELGKISTPEDQRQIFRSYEPRNNVELTPVQEAVKRDFVQPIMDMSANIRARLNDAGMPHESSNEGYIHREVMKRGGQIDRALRKGFGGGGGKNVLSTYASSLQKRSMFALEDQNGNISVIHRGDGRITKLEKIDGKVKATDLGSDNNIETAQDRLKRAEAEQQTDIKRHQERIDAIPSEDMARQLDNLDQRIAELEKQSRILATVKGRAPGAEAVHGIEPSFSQRAKISEKIDELQKQRDAIANDKTDGFLSSRARAELKRETDALNQAQMKLASAKDVFGKYRPADPVFRDKNGKYYRLDQASSDEIHAATDIQYHQNAAAAVATDWLQLRRAERAMDLLESMKESPEFKFSAWKEGEKKGEQPPEGWQMAPQSLKTFRGYWFEPHVAEVLNRFADELKVKPEGVYEKIGRVLTASLMLNPVRHIFNIGNHFLVERGPEGAFRMFNPSQWPIEGKAGLKAIRAVVNQNQDFHDALGQGAPMMSHRSDLQDLHQHIFDTIIGHLDKNPEMMGKIAQFVGDYNPVTLLNELRKVGQKFMWMSNDIFMLQSAYEKMERTGMSFHDAIRETARHIPDYRVPTRVLNSEKLSSFMRQPLLTVFSRYHYGQWKSYGHMIQDAMNVEGADTGPLRLDRGGPTGGGGGGDEGPGGPNGAGGFGEEAPRPGSAFGRRLHGVSTMVGLGVLTFMLYPVVQQFLKKITDDKDAHIVRSGASAIPYAVSELAKGRKTPDEIIQGTFTPAVLGKLLIEMGQNRDMFDGSRIFDPHSPSGEIAKDVTRKALETVGPVQQYTQAGRSEHPTRNLIAGQFGVSFPKSESQSNAMNMLHQYLRENHIMTPEDKRRFMNKVDARERGEIIAGQQRSDVRKVALGELKAYLIADFESRQPMIGLDQLRNVYKAATPEEKGIIAPFLMRKARKEQHSHMSTQADRDHAQQIEQFAEHEMEGQPQ